LLQVADETGTIMPGKRADVVVLAGDPFDLANLKANIGAVYSGGTQVRGDRPLA
jgi:imidazolonepropionase-like amidohydrolase